MPHKFSLGRIKATALGTIKDPAGVAGKAVDQAKGTVARGKLVADHVTKSASGVVISRLPGRRATPKAPGAPASAPTPPVQGTSVAPEVPAKKAPAKKAPAAKKTTTSIDAAADPSAVDVTPADVAGSVARKSPARRTPATKAAKKAPPSAPGAKLPPKKAPAKKAPAKKAPSAKAATSAPAKKAATTKPTGADAGEPTATDTGRG